MLLPARKEEQKPAEIRRNVFGDRILVDLECPGQLQQNFVSLGRLQMLHHVQQMLSRLQPVDDAAAELQKMQQVGSILIPFVLVVLFFVKLVKDLKVQIFINPRDLGPLILQVKAGKLVNADSLYAGNAEELVDPGVQVAKTIVFEANGLPAHAGDARIGLSGFRAEALAKPPKQEPHGSHPDLSGLFAGQ